jgi:hypothetical protein
MNIQQNDTSQTPSINILEVTSKQIFPQDGVKKINVNFEREEDMLVMCLSLFVHDYVHDYNLGSMHARVIKGNMELFDSLNVKISNEIFKIFSYIIGGHREIHMYDDSQFEDLPVNNNYKTRLYNYWNTFEENITQNGGDVAPSDIQIQLLKNIVSSEPTKLTREAKDNFLETKDRVIPEVKVIEKIDTQQIINNLIIDANFLNFFSSLKTYIVTFLTTDSKQLLTKEAKQLLNNLNTNFVSLDEIQKRNILMYNYILCSIDYIIEDFTKNITFTTTAEELDDILYTNLLLKYYSDLFYILKFSFINKYTELTNDPLDFLNSDNLLVQFIENYILYLTSKSFISNLDVYKYKGGVETSSSPDTPIEEKEEDALFMPQKEIMEVPVEEHVFIVHNNLLTTITRGIFLKLGIWNKLFPNETNIRFGATEIDSITFDRLQQIYPIIGEKGHKNNELLILEILILKKLLVELNPTKVLTMGSGIDDDLKDYLDTFYYDYFVKEELIKDYSEINIDDEVLVSEPVEGLNYEIFDENVDEEQEGGKKEEDEGIEMKTFSSTETPTETPTETLTETPTETLTETPTETLTETPTETLTETLTAPTSVDTTSSSIQKKYPPKLPVLLKKLKKLYQNNMYTIQRLKDSKIPTININNLNIDNLYDLLKYNQVLMKRKGTDFSLSAPKYKFIINNAANIAANINGSRLFIPRKFQEQIENIIDEVKNTTNIEEAINNLYSEITNAQEEIGELKQQILYIKLLEKETGEMTINDYNQIEDYKIKIKELERDIIRVAENKLFLFDNKELINDLTKNYEKWFKYSQPIFGLYRNLHRGVFCPTSSMMDAMDNCSLKYNTTEPKELGTTYYELNYSSSDSSRIISFGGVVLNYNINEQLTAKIDFNLLCKNGEDEDNTSVSTLDIQVSESNDLKARVAYRGVIERIKNILNSSQEGKIDEELDISKNIERLKTMWNILQYDTNRNNFNLLLGATSIKTMGDFLQECVGCFKWGGYVSSTEGFPENVKQFIQTNNIQPIFRSVSKTSETNNIIPYNNNGDALRLGIQGDRPSGFRSIYMLLNASTGINEQAIGGYMYTSATQNPSRTLLVSRNLNSSNKNGLNGNVIYVTRELQRPDKFSFLEYLQYSKTFRPLKSPLRDLPLQSVFNRMIIRSSINNLAFIKKPTEPKALKAIDYEIWLDYEKPIPESIFISKPVVIEEVKVEENVKQSAEEELNQLGNQQTELDAKIEENNNILKQLKDQLKEKLNELKQDTNYNDLLVRRSEIEEIENEKIKVEKNIVKLTNSLDKATSRKKTIITAEIESENKRLEEINNSLSTGVDINDLTRQINEIHELKGINNLNTEIDNLNNENKVLKKEVKELTKLIDNLNTILQPKVTKGRKKKGGKTNKKKYVSSKRYKLTKRNKNKKKKDNKRTRKHYKNKLNKRTIRSRKI